MINKLTEYIDTLFAGAPKTKEIQELKEEMLQNLIDKYNDLIAEGKTEEEAYQIAVASIGDVSALIGRQPAEGAQAAGGAQTSEQARSGWITAVAVALYVLGILPVLLFSGDVGVVLMFAMLALATGLLIYNSPKHNRTRSGIVASAVMLYMLCPMANVALHGVLGVAMMFVMIAVATGLLIYNHMDSKQERASGNASGGAAAPTGRSALQTVSIVAACLALTAIIGLCASSSMHDRRANVHFAKEGVIAPAYPNDDAYDHGDAYDHDDAYDRDDANDHDDAYDRDDAYDHDDADDRDDADDADDNDQADGTSSATKPGKSEQSGKQDKQQNGVQDGSSAAVDVVTGGGTIAAANVSKIEIDWISGAVHVVAGTGTDITLTETSAATLSGAQRMRYSLRNGKLTISYCADTWGIESLFSFIIPLGMPDKQLTVAIPASMLGQFKELEVNGISAEISVDGAYAQKNEIQSVSGTVEAGNLSGDELSVETTSGDMTLTGCSVRKLDVETVSGNARISASAEKADLAVVSGNLDASFASAPQKIEVEAVSGNTTITLPKDALNFTARLDTASGRFTSTIPTVRQNDVYIAGTGDAEYQFETVSGDIRLQTNS